MMNCGCGVAEVPDGLICVWFVVAGYFGGSFVAV